MARKHEISVDSLLSDLAEDRALARETKQVGAAIAATQLAAKLCGLLIDRKETGQPGDFAALETAGQVLDLIAREVGPDAAAALRKALQLPEEREELPATDPLPGNACAATEDEDQE